MNCYTEGVLHLLGREALDSYLRTILTKQNFDGALIAINRGDWPSQAPEANWLNF